MKWTVLSDNRSKDSSLITEHGLSIFLQTERHKILLDTGASDVFIRNAELLDIDLCDVDYVFISHGHSDHAGGLQYFLEHNRQAQVIVSPDAMSGMFFSKRGNLHSITTEWPEILPISLRIIPCPRGIKTSMCRMSMEIITTTISVMSWPCMSMACYLQAALIVVWRTSLQPVPGPYIPL